MPSSPLPDRAAPARVLALCMTALLAACGSSTSPTIPVSPPSSPNDISITPGASITPASAFSPNPKTVAAAGAASVSVRWVNRDLSGGYNSTSVTHDIVSDTGNSIASGNLAGNQTYSVSLAPGTYAYHCTIHPAMQGTLTITP